MKTGPVTDTRAADDGREARCYDLLRASLDGHAGMIGATLDRRANRVVLRYNPLRISADRVARIGARLDESLGLKFRQCRFGKDRRDSCSACTLRARDAAGDGIETDATAQRLTIRWPRSGGRHEEHQQALGVQPPVEPLLGRFAGFWEHHRLAVWSAMAAPFLAGGYLVPLLGLGAWQVPLFAACYIAGGWLAAWESIQALRARDIDINLLMTFAAIGAAILGRWGEGATLMFLFSLSNTLEHFALEKTKNAVRELMAVRPTEARIVDGGAEHLVAAENVRIGQHVLVHPGEKVPVDGTVTSGHSTVDQSAITGESVPVEREEGRTVYAGTLNLSGELVIVSTKRAEDTALAGIIVRVEQAQSGKTPTYGFVEYFGRAYAIGVLGLAAGVAVIGPLAFGAVWSTMFYRAMTLLVVASPCALVISTPAAVLSALATAARRGILFKGGRYLRTLGRIRSIAFDKTGTLTHGRPVLTDVYRLNGHSEDEILALAAALERDSRHPLAQAVIEAAEQRRLEPLSVSDTTTHPGRGLAGVWNTQRGESTPVVLGTERFVRESGIAIDSETMVLARDLETTGRTAIIVAGRHIWGILAAADVPRERAAELTTRLRAIAVEPTMLTGDNRTVANVVGSRLGIDDVRSQLLPEDKLAAVDVLRESRGPVALVGDGINDAPAMARADVGIAMGGSGIDVVMETADVVLTGDAIERLPWAIRLARRANRIVAQNVAFALITMALLIGATSLGEIGLTAGVIGHEGSTLVVVLNSLRLLMARGDG